MGEHKRDWRTEQFHQEKLKMAFHKACTEGVGAYSILIFHHLIIVSVVKSWMIFAASLRGWGRPRKSRFRSSTRRRGCTNDFVNPSRQHNTKLLQYSTTVKQRLTIAGENSRSEGRSHCTWTESAKDVIAWMYMHMNGIIGRKVKRTEINAQHE